MDVSDPQSLAPAFLSMLSYAADQAGGASIAALQNAFQQLGGVTDQALKLPPTALQALHSACDPLDWQALLVFAVLQIQKTLNDPQIWIGAYQPANWSPMLTLNYSPGAQAGAPPPPPKVTVGVAITAPPHGVWVSATDAVSYSIPPVVSGLTGSITTDGAMTWQRQFGQSPSAHTPSPTDPRATATAHVSWSPARSTLTNPVFNLTMGALSADVVLGSADPLYHAKVGLGPVGGSFTPQGALGNGLASELLSLGDVTVSYNPSLTIDPNVPPAFSLNS